MKLLVLLVVGAVLTVVAVPLGIILLVAAVATPAQAVCLPAATASGLPAAGRPRRVSLTNPPAAIPSAVEQLYRQAATRYGLAWELLAGIGMEETVHGANTKSDAHGVGLMQFLPTTWAEFGVDGDGDGRADITDDADSITSAAHYLVALGARIGGDGVRAALGVYNPNDWYGNDVLYYAAAYTGDDVTANPCILTGTTTSGGGGGAAATGPASGAVAAALRWIGTPYSWGGGTASGPTTGICCSPGGQDARNVVGFDCSGLVLYAYAQIGVSLPHLAHDITYNSGGQVIPRDFTAMRPGDAIGFSYAPGGRVFHVGLYLGDGTMVNSDGHGVSIATLTSGYYSRLAWRIVRFVP